MLKELLRRVLGKSILNYEELLTILCDFHKGIRRNDVLKVGDVVLIGHDNLRRIDWPLCVILEVYPVKDGDGERVARIKTSQGERIRPFQRLYPLEVSAKTEVGVLKKASRKTDLPVENIPNSPVEGTDNSV
ncbi:hypothetical protein AVEN_230737-1 [Araneus ventricosus]|uniref:DUF5641 domain-containing protein n=1 Tax=Araneus ventricosus TaxID=182803 RepID=A0A4Y2A1R1_ARAVE|nr:hypothetical protein AVEN_230737-1 [Araneus ventricosus]